MRGLAALPLEVSSSSNSQPGTWRLLKTQQVIGQDGCL